MSDFSFIFYEEDGILKCVNDGIMNPEDVIVSISKYSYFYGKKIIINDNIYDYNGPNEDDIKFGKVYNVKLYQRIILNPIQINVDEKKESKKNANYFLEYFLNIYRDINGFEYPIDTSKKLEYKKKIRQNIMDKFYEADFYEKDIMRYIRQHVYFGNYKGDIIYIDYLFNNNVITNYIMYLRGIKKITDLWQKLDINMSPLEKRKVKYLMNLNNIDTLSEDERKVCIKLYKIFDINKFNELKNKYGFENGFYAKAKIFEMIMTEELTHNIDELLIKCGHDKKYMQYEYIKEQLEENK
jgi:hypothetical protein